MTSSPDLDVVVLGGGGHVGLPLSLVLADAGMRVGISDTNQATLDRMIADQAGVDYTNVLRAIREDYPGAKDPPGPGFAAGPCLFKDAMQLAAFTADHFPMGQSAMQVNEGLPAYIVSALERRYGGLRGKTVGILGMAFKAESDDTRASLSYKLRKLLAWAGATVLATDPYVIDDRLVTLDEVLAQSDVLVLGAPHRAYRELQVGGKDVVDVWGVLSGGIRL